MDALEVPKVLQVLNEGLLTKLLVALPDERPTSMGLLLISQFQQQYPPVHFAAVAAVAAGNQCLLKIDHNLRF